MAAGRVVARLASGSTCFACLVIFPLLLVAVEGDADRGSVKSGDRLRDLPSFFNAGAENVVRGSGAWSRGAPSFSHELGGDDTTLASALDVHRITSVHVPVPVHVVFVGFDGEKTLLQDFAKTETFATTSIIRFNVTTEFTSTIPNVLAVFEKAIHTFARPIDPGKGEGDVQGSDSSHKFHVDANAIAKIVDSLIASLRLKNTNALVVLNPKLKIARGYRNGFSGKEIMILRQNAQALLREARRLQRGVGEIDESDIPENSHLSGNFFHVEEADMSVIRREQLQDKWSTETMAYLDKVQRDRDTSPYSSLEQLALDTLTGKRGGHDRRKLLIALEGFTAAEVALNGLGDRAADAVSHVKPPDGDDHNSECLTGRYVGDHRASFVDLTSLGGDASDEKIKMLLSSYVAFAAAPKTSVAFDNLSSNLNPHRFRKKWHVTVYTLGLGHAEGSSFGYNGHGPAGIGFDCEAFKKEIKSLAMSHQTVSFTERVVNLKDDPALEVAVASAMRSGMTDGSHTDDNEHGVLPVRWIDSQELRVALSRNENRKNTDVFDIPVFVIGAEHGSFPDSGTSNSPLLIDFDRRAVAAGNMVVVTQSNTRAWVDLNCECHDGDESNVETETNPNPPRFARRDLRDPTAAAIAAFAELVAGVRGHGDGGETGTSNTDFDSSFWSVGSHAFSKTGEVPVIVQTHVDVAHREYVLSAVDAAAERVKEAIELLNSLDMEEHDAQHSSHHLSALYHSVIDAISVSVGFLKNLDFENAVRKAEAGDEAAKLFLQSVTRFVAENNQDKGGCRGNVRITAAHVVAPCLLVSAYLGKRKVTERRGIKSGSWRGLNSIFGSKKGKPKVN
mgnify:CR=1 FL=1